MAQKPRVEFVAQQASPGAQVNIMMVTTPFREQPRDPEPVSTYEKVTSVANMEKAWAFIDGANTGTQLADSRNFKAVLDYQPKLHADRALDATTLHLLRRIRAHKGMRAILDLTENHKDSIALDEVVDGLLKRHGEDLGTSKDKAA